MLSNKMVSVQTGPEGLEVTKLLIAAGVDIAHEYYLAITTDRATRRHTLIASAEGGVEIEKVAHENPDAIIKAALHPLTGLQPYQAREVAFRLGFQGKQVGQAAKIMTNLVKLFLATDASLAEIAFVGLEVEEVANTLSGLADGTLDKSEVSPDLQALATNVETQIKQAATKAALNELGKPAFDALTGLAGMHTGVADVIKRYAIDRAQGKHGGVSWSDLYADIQEQVGNA